MTKSKFIEYAGEVQDYCLMLTKTSDVTGVEYFESEFASPLDIMEKMIFDQFDKKFDDSFSEEFWHLAGGQPVSRAVSELLRGTTLESVIDTLKKE